MTRTAPASPIGTFTPMAKELPIERLARFKKKCCTKYKKKGKYCKK